MMAKIKPDYELEQTKIKILKKENKLGYTRSIIKANERRIEFLNTQNGALIKGLEESIVSLKENEQYYVKQIADLNAYINEMLDLQQPKRKAKKKTTKKKTKKKKKTKAQLAAEKAAKKAAFEAEMAALKEEEETEEEDPGEEESQTETTT